MIQETFLEEMDLCTAKTFTNEGEVCGTLSVGSYADSLLRKAVDPRNSLYSLGCNGLLISPINMLALICKTANGLESYFFKITSP